MPSSVRIAIAFAGTNAIVDDSTSACGPVVCSFIQKRLVECASDTVFGPNQEQLEAFAKQLSSDYFSSENQLMQEQWNKKAALLALLQETLNCCVMLQCLQLVKLSVQSSEKSRVVWPLAEGIMPSSDWNNRQGQRRLIGETRVLLLSPLPWTPAAMVQMNAWLSPGSRTLFCCVNGLPIETAQNHIGMATCVGNDAHQRNVQCIDRTFGGDGLVDAVGLPGGYDLFFVTRAAFPFSCRELRRFYQGSECEWLVTEEKVKNKNIVTVWVHCVNGDLHPLEDCPWEKNQVLDIVKKLVPSLPWSSPGPFLQTNGPNPHIAERKQSIFACFNYEASHSKLCSAASKACD